MNVSAVYLFLCFTLTFINFYICLINLEFLDFVLDDLSIFEYFYQNCYFALFNDLKSV
jgi:hypothetical protein